MRLQLAITFGCVIAVGHGVAAPEASDPLGRTALDFLIAGQSNAGGVAAFSQECNVKFGMVHHPVIVYYSFPANLPAGDLTLIGQPGELVLLPGPPLEPEAFCIRATTSKDGLTWTDSPKSPILTTSKRTADSWDDGMVSQCSVHKIGDWYYVLYSGGTNNHGRKYTGKIAFGLARARHPEGPWEKYSHNPVFEATDKVRDFDGIFLQLACPVKVGDQWRLDCNGWTLNPKAKNSIGAGYSIGLAFASD